MIPRQGDGRQPELAVRPIPSDVDVHGLVAVETVEEERVRPRGVSDLRPFDSTFMLDILVASLACGPRSRWGSP